MSDDNTGNVYVLPRPVRKTGDIQTYNYWVPQNTGYTDGLSWFDSGSELRHFKTQEEAMKYNNMLMKEWNYPVHIKFRVIERTITEVSYYPTECKTHPKYKAIRKPSADCEACRQMFKERNL